jgi:hypothetical protein
MKGVFTFLLLLATLSSVTFADPEQPTANPSQETSATQKGISNATGKDKWCVFKDALGEPIPEATVEIFDTPTWKHERPRCIATVKLDEKGRLRPPASDPRLERCCFVVSHPDYGTALVEPRATMAAGDLLTSCTVPLVRIGARADKRSI